MKLNWQEQDVNLVINPASSIPLWDVMPHGMYLQKEHPFDPEKLEATFRVVSRVRGQEGGFIVVMCDREDAHNYDWQYMVAVTPETVLLSNFHVTVFEGLILYEAMQKQYHSYVGRTQFRLPSPRANGKKSFLPIIEIRLDQNTGMIYMCDSDSCILGPAKGGDN